jgi:hypothetical protein
MQFPISASGIASAGDRCLAVVDRFDAEAFKSRSIDYATIEPDESQEEG